MILEDMIREVVEMSGVDFFGVADLSLAHDAILKQGGPIVASYPRAITIGIALLHSIVDQLPQRAELQRMCARQKIGPGFLIHDSHLFDGVDPRQTGRALSIGARLAKDIGFQYLVTLNSGVISELPADFKIENYLLPERLTDATGDGGLFGIRFEPPSGQQREGGARHRKGQLE